MNRAAGESRLIDEKVSLAANRLSGVANFTVYTSSRTADSEKAIRAHEMQEHHHLQAFDIHEANELQRFARAQWRVLLGLNDPPPSLMLAFHSASDRGKSTTLFSDLWCCLRRGGRPTGCARPDPRPIFDRLVPLVFRIAEPLARD